MNTIRCEICGRFMGSKMDYVRYVPFGGYSDLTPSDPIFIHRLCFERSPSDHQKYVKSAYCYFKSWIKDY